MEPSYSNLHSTGEVCKQYGGGRGELNGPIGIAVDADGVMYVGECDNHRISLFTSKGRFLTSLGNEVIGPGLIDPIGLAVDTNGIVCVCDFKNNRILLF